MEENNEPTGIPDPNPVPEKVEVVINGEPVSEMKSERRASNDRSHGDPLGSLAWAAILIWAGLDIPGRQPGLAGDHQPAASCATRRHGDHQVKYLDPDLPGCRRDRFIGRHPAPLLPRLAQFGGWHLLYGDPVPGHRAG